MKAYLEYTSTYSYFVISYDSLFTELTPKAEMRGISLILTRENRINTCGLPSTAVDRHSTIFRKQLFVFGS